MTHYEGWIHTFFLQLLAIHLAIILHCWTNLDKFANEFIKHTSLAI